MVRTDHEAVYQITVKGQLDLRWSDWFDGMEIECLSVDQDQPVTTLTGPVVDQAALHGLLIKIRNLNLELISVWQMGKGVQT